MKSVQKNVEGTVMDKRAATAAAKQQRNSEDVGGETLLVNVNISHKQQVRGMKSVHPVSRVLLLKASYNVAVKRGRA